MQTTDVLIVGGGIVGLATAYQLLQRFPRQRVVVLEKESQLATHQTGRNSGVIHSGIYYKPGSLRATNCRAGKRALEEFCLQEGVEFDICGKVIVAVDSSEVSGLERILERGHQNGVTCEMIDAARLAELEPHVAGVQAIHVPETGIVNFRQVCHRLADRIQQGEGTIVTSARVTDIRRRSDGLIVESTIGAFETSYLVNCAGLYSDRVTQMSGMRPEAKIIPFRGEYYALKPEVHHLCRNLIYPVPDPSFPFLGVHFTRMIDGTIECGPNAVLAFAREGYTKADVNLKEMAESLSYPGFLKLAARYWRTGAGEMWRSMSKRAFVKALSRLIPEIQADQLEPAPAGVRAQAVSRDGTIVDDFIIQSGERIVNVGNAPSPAATASLNIGKLVVEQIAPQLT